MQARKMDTKKMITLGVLAALAYVLMFVGRIPITPVAFLKYDPKDIVITIGGFIYGPMSALMISIVVSVVEMFTVSDTGPIGLIMNVASTFAFACTASFIYQKRKSLSGAAIGLIAGMLLATAVMILWNYLITPFYMNVDRAEVAGMLVPLFLPFNLLKGSLNAAFTMILYKPLVTALRKARLAPESEGKGKTNFGAMAASVLVLATCVLLVLAYRGII